MPTVANGGVHYDPECIISIEDKNGNVIVDNSDPTGERVFSREVARAALDCMEVVIDNGTGKAARPDNGQEAAARPVPPTTRRTAGFAV